MLSVGPAQLDSNDRQGQQPADGALTPGAVLAWRQCPLRLWLEQWPKRAAGSGGGGPSQTPSPDQAQLAHDDQPSADEVLALQAGAADGAALGILRSSIDVAHILAQQAGAVSAASLGGSEAVLAMLRARQLTQSVSGLLLHHDGLVLRIDLLQPTSAGLVLVKATSGVSASKQQVDHAAMLLRALLAALSGSAQAGLAAMPPIVRTPHRRYTATAQAQAATAAINAESAAAVATVARVEIAHLNRAFHLRAPGDYTGLIQRTDISTMARAQVARVQAWVDGAFATLAGPMPPTEMGSHCKRPVPCPFVSLCKRRAKPDPGYPLSVLPGPRGKRLADQLAADGYTDVREVPAARITDPVLARVRAATISGEPILEPAAQRQLKALPWPRYYLDFETVGLAIPRWAGPHPHEPVPFQWSCHIEQADGTLTEHGFLDVSGDDPRRACAQALLEVLGNDAQAPILAYNANFESSVIGRLARDFHDLAPALRKLQQRLVDLEPIARNHYYHRDMRGSWSLKAVLPTVAPDLAYGELDGVQDGMGAQLGFLEASDPKTPAARRAALIEQLKAYCALDTLALVRIARRFQAG